MTDPFEFDALEDLTPAEILSLVRMHLPAWTRACEASDTDGIALHESEFGTSSAELLLFACAIKFAAGNGKNVYVACGKGTTPSVMVPPAHPFTVVRERTKRRRRQNVRRAA
jgi:hypothetical protein